MWRLIKLLFFLALVVVIALFLTGKKIGGKTIEEHLQPLFGKTPIKESVKDIRALVGEGLKAAGEAISEDVTDEERKQLDNLVKQELMEGKPIDMAPGQKALPAVPRDGGAPADKGRARPSVKQMEVMPTTITPETDTPN